MSERLSREDQLARVYESYLICEKLLGWHKCLPDSKGWRNSFDWEESEDTPDFSSWGQAGLILDALQTKGVITSIQFTTAGYCAIDSVSSDPPAIENIPLAIRTAALKYIRSLP